MRPSDFFWLLRVRAVSFFRKIKGPAGAPSFVSASGSFLKKIRAKASPLVSSFKTHMASRLTTKGFSRRILFKRLFLSLFFFCLAGAVFFLGFLFFLLRGLPDVGQITQHTVAESTKIYDRTGTILLYEISAGEKRTVVPLGEIPLYLREATIAIEDQNFYTSPPFSIKGILRSALVNLSRGEISQGGSTITQQLARNAFLSAEQTITRKLKELVLAIQIGRRYSKDEILELYLNEIPYGPTTYGVESASRAFFGKPARDLTLAESAVFAALPKAPSYYSPWGTHVKSLLDRSHLVLKKMHELGYIDDREFNEAMKAQVVFLPQDTTGIRAPHFVIAVQDYLVGKYGEELVRTGGLSVKTTLDWPLQEVAERVVKEGAERNERLYGGENSALVAENPQTGELLALVGSRDYFDTEREGNFNVATQGLRQPGSALKPFVYLSAFTRGYTPETLVMDVPTEFSTQPECPILPVLSSENKRCFHPQNFDGKFRGPVQLKKALAESVNVPAVKVLYLAGMKYTLSLLQGFGLTTLNDPNRFGLSLVLGGGEVHLVDLVGAYSVLAKDGVLTDQTMVLEIRDRKGNILESFVPRETRVVDAQHARQINDILSDTVLRAGLFQSSLPLTLFPGHDVALKTGTTNDYRDAWALGYAPNLAVGVWAGNNDNTPMHAQGSSILAAVPIWSAFMNEAVQNLESVPFIRPAPVLPEKPVLRGILPERELHSILYYVDKENPDSLSVNPLLDPQFERWEQAVLDWGRRTIPDFSSYNQTSGQTSFQNQTNSTVSVSFVSPLSGTFVSPGFSLIADARSNRNIVRYRVYVNGNEISSAEGSFGTSYRIFLPFSGTLEPQNVFRIEVEDESGFPGSAEVFVYAQ